MPSQLTSEYEPVTPLGRAPARDGDEGWRAVSRTEPEGDGGDDSGASGGGARTPKAEAGRDAARGAYASARRGHALAFAGLFLFTFVLYFRPYELVSFLSPFSTMAFWTAVATLAVFFPAQFALEGRLTARPREVNLVLLLVVGGLLSIPLAINPGEAWETFNDPFIKVVLMFLVMVNVVRTKGRLYGLLWLSLAVGCYLGYHAIGDYRAGKFEVEGYRVGGAIGGMFDNPNDMALYLVTTMPLAVGMFLATRNPLAKLVYAGCAALAVCGSVVTYS